MSQDTMEVVATELPCLWCDSERATRIRARLGALYLDLENRKLPQIPTRAELTHGCCRRVHTVTHRIAV
jgi:hypothetical protein